MPASNVARLKKYLLADREAVVVLGDFSPLIEDLDLHILSCGLNYDGFVRQLLADGVSALALHLTLRPRDEYVGWTVSIQKPEPLNLFFTGNSGSSSVAGRAFLEGVEPRDENVFVAQVKRGLGELRASTVAVEGVDLYGMVEAYYEQSEQNLARFFHRSQGPVAMVAALPDADPDWLRGLDGEAVFAVPSLDQAKLLAAWDFSFRCGCDASKVGLDLFGLTRGHPELLFASEDEVTVDCRRCGASYRFTRRDYEACRQRHEELRVPSDEAK
jgi:hypothetical protein